MKFQLLADYFNDNNHDVETYVEKNSALASEKAKNETELEVARRIQYGIIARKRMLSLPIVLMFRQEWSLQDR